VVLPGGLHLVGEVVHASRQPPFEEAASSVLTIRNMARDFDTRNGLPPTGRSLSYLNPVRLHADIDGMENPRNGEPLAATSADFVDSLTRAGLFDTLDHHAAVEAALGIPLNEEEFCTALYFGYPE